MLISGSPSHFFQTGTPSIGQDLQFAALGVEDDVPVIDDGRGRSVVGGLVLPGEAAVVGVEGVEVVAAEAAAHEDAAIDHGRCRQ